MAGSNAIFVRGIAGCGPASVDFASYESGRMIAWPDVIRSVHRILYRPYRKETASPFPAGIEGSFLPDGRMQPRSREVDRLSAIAFPQTIALAAKELDCSSVAFTYNDPVIFLEYEEDLALASAISLTHA